MADRVCSESCMSDKKSARLQDHFAELHRSASSRSDLSADQHGDDRGLRRDLRRR